jgi:hypothetical protein
LGDAIYDNEKLKQAIKDNNIDSIMAPNKRNTNTNTKDPKKLSYKHKQKSEKRDIVENCFSWLTQNTPRFYRVFPMCVFFIFLFYNEKI